MPKNGSPGTNVIPADGFLEKFSFIKSMLARFHLHEMTHKENSSVFFEILDWSNIFLSFQVRDNIFAVGFASKVKAHAQIGFHFRSQYAARSTLRLSVIPRACCIPGSYSATSRFAFVLDFRLFS